MVANSMGISVPTVGRYLDLLEAARMLRRWQPMRINLNKRLVKTPKTYRPPSQRRDGRDGRDGRDEHGFADMTHN